MASVGDFLLESSCYAHVISSESVLESVCDSCLETRNIFDNIPPNKLFRCSKCRQSYYCNNQCQKRAWSLHKYECKYLQNIAPKSPPSVVKLILRILFKNKLNPKEKEILPDGKTRSLDDLKMHLAEIKSSPERIEAFRSFLCVIRACVGDMFTSDTVFQTYCKVIINSTEITDVMGNTIGTGLFLGLSAVDHSCQPNANVVFSGTRVILRAMTSIPSPVWSSVRINYLGTILPTAIRQKRLEEAYYFQCKCELCVTKDQELDKLCQGCHVCVSCKGPVADTCDSCPDCGQLNQFDQSDSQLFDHSSGNETELLKTYPFLKRTYHIYDYRMIEFSEKALAACLNLSEFEMFYDISENLLIAYKKYLSPYSVSFALHLAKLAKMAIYLGKNEEALDYLLKCFKTMKLSHGDSSKMLVYLNALRDSISL